MLDDIELVLAHKGIVTTALERTTIMIGVWFGFATASLDIVVCWCCMSMRGIAVDTLIVRTLVAHGIVDAGFVYMEMVRAAQGAFAQRGQRFLCDPKAVWLVNTSRKFREWTRVAHLFFNLPSVP